MISEVRKIKFLGVMLDNKVNRKDHINYISGKVSRGIGMILKARRYPTKKALMTLYYSFIYPYLTYCNHIWGSTYQTNLMKLQKLQNRIRRIICNTNRRDHVRQLAYFSWVISTSTWYVVLCSACAIIMFLMCFTPFSKGIVNSIIMKPEQLITFMFHLYALILQRLG